MEWENQGNKKRGRILYFFRLLKCLKQFLFLYIFFLYIHECGINPWVRGAAGISYIKIPIFREYLATPLSSWRLLRMYWLMDGNCWLLTITSMDYHDTQTSLEPNLSFQWFSEIFHRTNSDLQGRRNSCELLTLDDSYMMISVATKNNVNCVNKIIYMNFVKQLTPIL